MMLLSFEETKKILEKYNIPEVEGRIIESPEEGILFAREFAGWSASAKTSAGEPVVLKIDYEELTHRTDMGLVKLGVSNEKELKKAFLELKKDFEKGRVLIQRTADRGVEMIAGMKRDPAFGAFLVFGLGGVFVEILKDVSFAILPITEQEAYKMISKLRGYTLFKGYRGKDPLYIEKVIKVLLSLSELSQKEEGILEVNFNPLFVSEKEVIVADAKIDISTYRNIE